VRCCGAASAFDRGAEIVNDPGDSIPVEETRLQTLLTMAGGLLVFVVLAYLIVRPGKKS
jgi:hypothetical protein